MRKEAPLAFDLSLYEGRAFQTLPDERATVRFKEDVFFLLKELGAVSAVGWFYRGRRENGKLTLFSPNYDEPMCEHYLQPALDKTKPLWYQRRCQIEYQTFCLLEQKLSDAQPGDLFVWPSPPPSEKKEEEITANGFGKHSFLFVYRLEKDFQEERVECFALRNYLNLEGFGRLLSFLTGKKATFFSSEALLAQLDKVEPPQILSVLDIKKAIREVYESTPLSERIVPEDDFFLQEQEADRILEQFLPQMERIGHLLKVSASQELVEGEFFCLVRDALKALMGSKVDLFLPGWEASSPFPFSPSELFALVGHGSGSGIGFGASFLRQGSPYLINYQTAENSFLKESKEYVVCPVCGLKVKKGVGTCPYCHVKLAEAV